MAQIFKPSSNVLSRFTIVLAAAAPVVLILAGSTLTRSSANTKVNMALDQPVPFSHQHHVDELGIDCRYCHSSVEKSAFAGVPPTHTCMSCHSQIWTNSPLLEPIRSSYANQKPVQANDGSIGWNRVNKLPEFVYFNHSIHVNRGVSCNQCHGPVQKMQMTYKGQAFFMSWCLECHNNPEKFLYRNPETEKTDKTQSDQVFSLYRRVHDGIDKLSDRERALINGDPYEPTSEEVSKGEALVKKLKIKKDQLADCWVCHR